MVPRLLNPQFVGGVPALWQRDHATPVLNVPGPVTEAVNWKVSPVAKEAVDGVT
jgi:hypothetical protein